MKNFINNIKADKLAYRGFILSMILLLSSIGYIGFYYKKMPPFIPIFNQLPWGYSRITPTIYIFIPISLCFVFIISNLILTSLTYNKNPLIGRMFAATNLIIGAINFIFIVRTILEVI